MKIFNKFSFVIAVGFNILSCIMQGLAYVATKNTPYLLLCLWNVAIICLIVSTRQQELIIDEQHGIIKHLTIDKILKELQEEVDNENRN
jgi:hypothetical protein